MKDQFFLMWLHESLIKVHKVSPSCDYMYKLRAIIRATDPNKMTPDMRPTNRKRSIKKDT